MSPRLKSSIGLMPYCDAASRNASSRSPVHARRLDAPFAACPVKLALAEEMVRLPAKQRQHVVPAPAPEPELAPVIVVGRLPAHVDHGVDRRRAADHLAARIVERAAVEARFGLGLEHPVGARIADREQVADRNVKPDPVVLAAGFQQQHAIGRIGGQPVGQHAARRARADDDVVVLAVDRRRVGHTFPLSPAVKAYCGGVTTRRPRPEEAAKRRLEGRRQTPSLVPSFGRGP